MLQRFCIFIHCKTVNKIANKILCRYCNMHFISYCDYFTVHIIMIALIEDNLSAKQNNKPTDFMIFSEKLTITSSAGSTIKLCIHYQITREYRELFESVH